LEPPKGQTAVALVEDAKRFRESAERCRRLAKGTLDNNARMILLNLADDFDRRVVELCEDQPDKS